MESEKEKEKILSEMTDDEVLFYIEDLRLKRLEAATAQNILRFAKKEASATTKLNKAVKTLDSATIDFGDDDEC